MPEGVIYHRARSTSRTTKIRDAAADELPGAMVAHPILIQRRSGVTAEGDRPARPVGAVREVL